MSTTIHRLYRAAQPSADDLSRAVHPPSTSAATSAGHGSRDYALKNNASEAAVCDVAVHPPQLKHLVAGAPLQKSLLSICKLCSASPISPEDPTKATSDALGALACPLNM